MVNKERGSTYSWLKGCPPSDNNFKGELYKADAETLEELLNDLELPGNVTRIRVLEARLRRLKRRQTAKTSAKEKNL